MSILKLIKRWSPNSPQILLSPQAVPAKTEMVLDMEKGEYMRFNDLLILLQNMALVEMNKDLSERLADGNAQQMLLKRLSKMGYEDFDQVMQVLNEQRGTVLKQKEYEIWQEGYVATGESQQAYLRGKATGYSFLDAVDNYISSQSSDVKDCFNADLDVATIWGCRLFDNEADARKFNG